MKSKLTPQRIAEINREIKERFGKLPTSLFRCWCDEVIIKLKSSPDRVVFDAILSTEFATPDCAEWRKKHDVSMKNIEDELLVANGEITAVNKQIQPLNDIQVRWLREWFANNNDEVNGSLSIDEERLGSFFNAKFKGCGGNPNHFVDLVNDIQTIKVGRELGMVAVMIFECSCFIKKPSTFTKWFREFFDIIGRECPKENHKNKYQPSDTIRRMFYYLD